MAGNPEEGPVPGSRVLAEKIATCLACRLLDEGRIVEDPLFAGDPRHEARAAAFTLATLTLSTPGATPCDAGTEKLMRELAAHIEALRGGDGLWGNKSASVFVLAFLLEALERIREKPEPWTGHTLKEATTRPHLPNQEALAIYALTLYHKLTGSGWALARARRRLRLLSWLARPHGYLWEPWGDAPIYNSAAAWFLRLAHRAGLEPAGPLARRLSLWTRPLLSPLQAHGVPLLTGRSSWFSFNIPTLLASVRGVSPKVLEAALGSLAKHHYLERCPFLARNPAREPVIMEYGVEEVYASWAARALLDTSTGTGEEPLPTSAPEASMVSWPGGLLAASARGYDGFGNYQPPCTPTTIVAGGSAVLLSTLTGTKYRSALAPAQVDGVPAAVASRVECLSTPPGVECRCRLEADGGGVRRRLILAPGRIVVLDEAARGRRVETRIAVQDPTALEVGGAAEAGRVMGQAGPLTVYTWEGRGTVRAEIVFDVISGDPVEARPALVPGGLWRYKGYLALGPVVR